MSTPDPEVGAPLGRRLSLRPRSPAKLPALHEYDALIREYAEQGAHPE